jgi:methylated-DNA-[protein]-cysteine S-methyltransferase
MPSETFDTPAGPITITVDDAGALTSLRFAPASDPSDGGESAALRRARTQIEEYFAGRRQSFDLPLAPGGTAFQRAVWDALATIPFGETRSYGQLAAQLGRPTAARAVGAANGANPIALIVPCHRVIGSDGSLTGFAYGTERKAWLLDFERRDPQPKRLF